MKTAATCVTVDDKQGLSDILEADERVIALFSASWCPFCVSFLPVFEKCSKSGGGSFVIVQDDQETIGEKYAVEVVPTALFFEKGKVAKRLDGVLGVGLTEKRLTDFIKICAPQH